MCYKNRAAPLGPATKPKAAARRQYNAAMTTRQGRRDWLRNYGLAALVLLGCTPQASGGSAQDAAIAAGKPLIDIPKLVNKNPDQVAAVLGSAVKVIKIKDDFSLMPGDDRTYKPAVTGKEALVRFHRKKAVYFDITFAKPIKDPRTALHLLGLNPTSTPYLDVATATRWRDEVSGFTWKDISVVNSKGGHVADVGYDEVFATLEQPAG